MMNSTINVKGLSGLANLLGVITLRLRFRGKEYEQDFYVVDTSDIHFILGIDFFK